MANDFALTNPDFYISGDPHAIWTELRATDQDEEADRIMALAADAVNGGLPAQRNHLDLRDILEEVYHTSLGLSAASAIPNAKGNPWGIGGQGAPVAVESGFHCGGRG